MRKLVGQLCSGLAILAAAMLAADRPAVTQPSPLNPVTPLCAVGNDLVVCTPTHPLPTSTTITGSTSNASDGVATSATNVPTVSYNYGFNGTTWDRLQVDANKFLKIVLPAETTKVIGTVNQGTSPWVVRGNTTPTVANGNGIVLAPSSETGAAVAPSATQAAASNSVLKASAGNLYSLTATIGATSGWLMVFDATSLPSNGATGASLKYCLPVNTNGTSGGQTLSWPLPLSFATGITAGFSSTACNSLTASATAFFYAQVQ